MEECKRRKRLKKKKEKGSDLTISSIASSCSSVNKNYTKKEIKINIES